MISVAAGTGFWGRERAHPRERYTERYERAARRPGEIWPRSIWTGGQRIGEQKWRRNTTVFTKARAAAAATHYRASRTHARRPVTVYTVLSCPPARLRATSRPPPPPTRPPHRRVGTTCTALVRRLFEPTENVTAERRLFRLNKRFIIFQRHPLAGHFHSDGGRTLFASPNLQPQTTIGLTRKFRSGGWRNKWEKHHGRSRGLGHREISRVSPKVTDKRCNYLRSTNVQTTNTKIDKC